MRSRSFAPDDQPPADGRLLHVLPGTHAEQFPAEAFVGQEYTVTAESNRMGLRLAGQPVPRQQAEELLSAPVCPGTVQITHDGRAIVLGVDAQTIGGYPRIAHVIAADLDKLAQLRPGDRIRFQWVEHATAIAQFRARQAWLHAWVTRLRHSLL
jgi:antagonist of KipI